MSLSIGIVGLPNVGKSTLFNALTKAQNAQAANYPFCTIEPNKATVAVPDERVDALSAKVSPKKTIHASVDFIDIAGLVRGASKGEGLGNQFLGNIRECAAIVEVVRCFEDENITHVDGSVDPLRDIDTIETELLLADLQSVERRLEKLQKMAKGSKDAKAAAEIMQGLLEHLNAGNGARSFELPDNETFLQSWRELGLLTAKPVIYCANVDEAAVADGNDFVARVQQLAEERHSGFASAPSWKKSCRAFPPRSRPRCSPPTASRKAAWCASSVPAMTRWACAATSPPVPTKCAPGPSTRAGRLPKLPVSSTPTSNAASSAPKSSPTPTT